MNGDYVGKVCICSLGRVGVVTGRKTLDWGETWVGMGFDGKGLWASKTPHVLAETVKDYCEMVESKPSQVLYAP